MRQELVLNSISSARSLRKVCRVTEHFFVEDFNNSSSWPASSSAAPKLTKVVSTFVFFSVPLPLCTALCPHVFTSFCSHILIQIRLNVSPGLCHRFFIHFYSHLFSVIAPYSVFLAASTTSGVFCVFFSADTDDDDRFLILAPISLSLGNDWTALHS